MLPPPAMLRDYPLEVQSQMLKWNDAFTIDESKRQDKLVDVEVENARKGPGRALTVLYLFGIAAIVFFATGNNEAGLALLAVPGLAVVGQLLSAVASASSRPRDKSDKPDA